MLIREKVKKYFSEIRETERVFDLNKLHESLTFDTTIDNLFYDLLSEVIVLKAENIALKNIDNNK